MKRFKTADRMILGANPVVLKVTEHQVIFTGVFKREALRLQAKGNIASDIFEKSGINVSLFPADYFMYLLKRWRQKAALAGHYSLEVSGRGKNHPGPKKKRVRTVEDLEAIIAVQAELIEAIKKKRALPKKN